MRGNRGDFTQRFEKTIVVLRVADSYASLEMLSSTWYELKQHIIELSPPLSFKFVLMPPGKSDA
jgi:hypothetical protein